MKKILDSIKQNDVDAARDAYDAFLGHYPYCYGYWRKYADYEKRKGENKNKCNEVCAVWNFINAIYRIDIYFVLMTCSRTTKNV